MERQLVLCILLGLILSSSASAQSRTGGKTSGRVTSSTPTGPPLEDPSSQRMFLFGKVVLDDGAPLTEAATIQTICKGQKHNETYTDSHGSFSFEFGSRSSNTAAGIGDADTSLGGQNNRSNQREWRDCELQAVLPGFSSQLVDLSSRVSSFESNDLGRVVLHRLSQVEGSTISATTMLAPAAARKAFEKGREKEKKEKWDEAKQSFEKAVGIYPKYAIAWFELGRIQLRNNEMAQARHSFDQALAADPKYVSPYRALAELAVQEKRWQEVVDITGKLLTLNAASFPDAWFRNAVANYNLQNFEAAEKSARQGLKLDEAHQIPKMEYLLGLILIQKHEYQEASEHIRKYLPLATKPADLDEAQERLAEIAKLSTTASAPPRR